MALPDPVILGIDLGGTKIHSALADLSGNVLFETRFEHNLSLADESFALLISVIRQFLEKAQELKRTVRGIGIGVPGIVQPEDGKVINAPALDWQNFPLKTRLSDYFSYPILIANDVNLAALGEARFGADKVCSNLVYVSIGTGVGAGIVIMGKIHPGFHNMAGEVGYFPANRDDLGKSYPGFGAFEQIASGTGIAALAQQSLRSTLSEEQIDAITSKDVFDAAKAGDSWASKIALLVVDHLAQLVAGFATILDPEVIYFGGGVSASADQIIGALYSRLEGVIPAIPKLKISQLGDRAPIMGAVAHFLED